MLLVFAEDGVKYRPDVVLVVVAWTVASRHNLGADWIASDQAAPLHAITAPVHALAPPTVDGARRSHVRGRTIPCRPPTTPTRSVSTCTSTPGSSGWRPWRERTAFGSSSPTSTRAGHRRSRCPRWSCSTLRPFSVPSPSGAICASRTTALQRGDEPSPETAPGRGPQAPAGRGPTVTTVPRRARASCPTTVRAVCYTGPP